MKMTVLSPGKVREAWIQDGITEYVKRLGRYCQVVLQQVEDCPDSWPADKAVAEEGRRLLARISAKDWVVALDLRGSQPDSLELAEWLPRWFQAGGSSVIFVIGGSSGLAPAVLERAQERLCLSRMTFTHQMTRLLLLEQCYRAFRIQAGEPYHK